MTEARVIPRFAALYPRLEPGRWYRVGQRGVDAARPEGPTRSGGGPIATEGVWLVVGEDELHVFRQHLELRERP